MSLKDMFISTKRAKIQRLTLLRDRFVENIPDAQFKYDKYVTKYDAKHGCGTICCIVGWLPEIFPTIFKWAQVGVNYVVKIRQAPNYDFHRHVQRFFGINANVYGYIFEGRELIDKEGRVLQPAVVNMRKVSKKVAVRRMNRAIELIQSDIL